MLYFVYLNVFSTIKIMIFCLFIADNDLIMHGHGTFIISFRQFDILHDVWANKLRSCLANIRPLCT